MRRSLPQFLLSALVCTILLLPEPGNCGPDDTVLESFLANTPILPKDEIRAAWIVRFALNSKEDVDRAVDYAVRARFHLLFVQVRGRADAYYTSALEPEGLSLTQSIAEFDPFDYLLRRAHEAGIAVHAWVNVCYVWSDGRNDPPPGHIVREHPEWLVVNRAGVRMDERPVDEWRGVAGYFVSPALSAVRNHTTEVVRDIVTRYVVDGVHLDYIRYPGPEFDLSEAQRTAFTLRYGVDPLVFLGGGHDRGHGGERAGEHTGEYDGGHDGRGDEWVTAQGVSVVLDSLYTEWRSAQVDSLVISIRKAVGDIPLSAAVVPDAERSRVDKGQNWVKWIQDGVIDFVVPMAYNYEPGELVPLAQRITRMVGAGRFLMGLPVYGGRERYLGYSVSLLRREGVLGYALFSYNELEKEPFSIQFLERVFFQTEGE